MVAWKAVYKTEISSLRQSIFMQTGRENELLVDNKA
jgi:hypothetical protein